MAKTQDSSEKVHMGEGGWGGGGEGGRRIYAHSAALSFFNRLFTKI